MSPAEIRAALAARFPGLADHPPDDAPWAAVEPSRLRDSLVHLRDALSFTYLVFATGLDKPADATIELVYRLFSPAHHAAVVLRVGLPRDAARVPTVSDLFRTADWHERETAELFGVTFEGHPDPRRLLLPDDLEGFPLRKDFSHPNMIRLPEVE
jgi:NADH-quinone oxidoreductase subunit C